MDTHLFVKDALPFLHTGKSLEVGVFKVSV
jgi:hypothetical protein